MVKHIVLFKLKEELSAEKRWEVMNSFKNAIEALPASIGFIKHVEVGLNMNPAEQWDIALNSDFETMDEVRAYAAHPDHVAAASILGPYKESRACVDYVY